MATKHNDDDKPIAKLTEEEPRPVAPTPEEVAGALQAMVIAAESYGARDNPDVAHARSVLDRIPKLSPTNPTAV